MIVTIHAVLYVSRLKQYCPGYLEPYTNSCKNFPTVVEDSASGFFSHVDPTEPLSIWDGRNLCYVVHQSQQVVKSRSIDVYSNQSNDRG